MKFSMANKYIFSSFSLLKIKHSTILSKLPDPLSKLPDPLSKLPDPLSKLPDIYYPDYEKVCKPDREEI